ncbi:MAG: hypothetical protein JKY65_19655 [Planctomycetes bacterium]|nr:hypothetical protein [Planctomycetota bacterium]
MPNRDPLTRAALALAASVLLCASPALAAPREARLLEVTSKGVKLNLGARAGVKVGHIYDLYREAEVYVLPLTRGKVPLVKPQRRVASVQVYEVEPTTSLARVLTREGKGRLDPRHLIGVYNPTAAAPNREPTFTGKSETFSGTWGSTVRIWLDVSNEPDDSTVYTWSVSGGRLRYTHTTRPLNFWTPPLKAGESSLQVTVRDSANNEASRRVSVVSLGPKGSGEIKRFSVSRRTYGSASRYGGRVADVAFEWKNTPYVLTSKEGWGGKARVWFDRPTFHARATNFSREVPAKRDFRSLVVLAASSKHEDYGAVFGIDADEKVVVRHNLDVKWRLSIPPLIIGVPDGGAGNGRFSNPVDIALSRDEDLYVLDAEQRCVQVFKVSRGKGARASFLVSFGRPGKEKYDLQRPVAMAIGRDDVVYVLDAGRRTVVVYRNWRPVGEFLAGGPEEVLSGIAVDPYKDEVYVLSKSKGRVRRYSQQGQLLKEFGGGVVGVPSRLDEPVRIRISPARELWVLDRGGESVVRFGPERGLFRGRTGGVELSGSLRVAAGPTGGFSVLSPGSYRVTRFDRAGWVIARFGREGTKSGEFEEPVDLAIGASNEVYVLDADQQRVHHFGPRGAVRASYGKGLEGVIDLSAVDNRSHLAVIQQRERGNIALLTLGLKPARSAGRDYTGDLTPRFGCVTGVTGSLGGGGRGKESQRPWLWTIDEDRELIYLARQGQSPRKLGHEFDQVNDLEASPNGQVFAVDSGDDEIVFFSSRSGQATVFKDKKLDEPWDLGIDDYGHVFVYDAGRKLVLELTPQR